MGSIQLDETLLSSVQELLIKHDDSCKEVGVGIQYMAAITGYLTANLPGDMEQKRNFLQQLFQFADKVMSDNSEAEATASASAPPAGNNNAFGIWEPKTDS